MSKIDTLVAELCPDGVEYRKLGEIEDNGYLKLGRGKVISKKDIAANLGNYPIYSASAANDGKMGEYGSYMFDDVRLTWSVDGGGKFFYRDASKYSVTNVCGWLKVLDEQSFSTRFLYYVLSSQWSTMSFDYVTKAHPSVIRELYRIPIVPIPIQREIVRILDTFAALTDTLTDTLTEELDCRGQQYAYYRDRLLSRESLEALEGTPVEMKKLGDIGTFYGGLTGKSKEDFKEGGAPFVPYTNVYNNAAVDFRKLESVKVAGGEGQHAIAYGDVLVTGSSENPDDCGMTSVVMQLPEVQTYLNSFCFGWRPNSLDAFEPGYLKYAFRAYGARRQIVKTANGVTRFNISKEAFGRVEIPVPSLATQQKVVDILDRFDALTTSLTDGLPAEIEARKAQYGYYRDRLLTFPRKEVAAS